MGKPAIFHPKDGKPVRSGPLTKSGTKKFEEARKRLAKIAGWPLHRVSDGDTIIYLAIGEDAARAILQK